MFCPSCVLCWGVGVLAALVVTLFTVRLINASRHKVKDLAKLGPNDTVTVGIFHPYCNAGGGGERVLWFAVEALQQMSKNISIVIYARQGDGDSKGIVSKAKARFGVENIDEEKLRFVFLQRDRLLEASTYPRLTLVGQSLGSMIVGAEALSKFCPDIYLDSMGYAFTYPIAWLYGCGIATYTHYPTISTDMLQRVYERRPAYNNDELVSGSVMNSRIKYVYYRLFCYLYKFVGLFPKVVMVNSNWTGGHINSLWGIKANVVFPPCDTNEFTLAQQKKKKRVIVSLGQFRPEKDHRLQIQSFADLLKRIKKNKKINGNPRLQIFGSCRDEEDENRIKELEAFATKLGINDYVDFCVNKSFPELKTHLSSALMGIHTMWNEHFGIAPVEMMAAGIILVSNNSGGPKIDIIKHGETGYLASSSEEYAEIFESILEKYDSDGGDSNKELQEVREAAIQSMERFKQEAFIEDFKTSMRVLVPNSTQNEHY